MDNAGRIVLSLPEAVHCSASEVGGKAVNLALLQDAGFPVPDGFVITVQAFVAFVELNGFDADTPPNTVRTARLPAEVAAGLNQVMEQLGGPVAVRSSGVAEDLVGASYAGQYETVLGVEGTARAEAAVLHCWASAFDGHVLRYHQANGNNGVPEMAVLVQQMVPAETAGVAFSANPVTGDRDEVVINAVPGLADRLVAGEVDGEQWTVRAGVAKRADSGVLALGEDQAMGVAGLAREVERYFGTPQDIEWAIVDGEIHLVQARAITALPVQQIEVPIEVPEGYWEREASHAPRPWTPLTSSLAYEDRNSSLRQVLADFGVLVEAVEFAEIGGWEYVRLVPLGGKDRPAPPSWLMPVLYRLMPPVRNRVRQAIEAVRSNRAGSLVDRWYKEWHPDLKQRIASLRSVDIPSLSDSELTSHWYSVVELFRYGARAHFTLHAAICFALAELAFASTEILGWEESRVWELLAGLSHMSTEPSRRLGELAAIAATRPETRRIITEGGAEALDRLRRTDPAFASEFDSYLEEFGTRALDYDIATPSLAEKPELALGLITDLFASGFNAEVRTARLQEARTAALDEARTFTAAKPKTDQERWESALVRAERAYPVREDNEFYTFSAPLALIRYAALEIGRRLVERAQVVSADDVFFLRHNESVEAMSDGQPRMNLVTRRRAERSWVEAHPGPATYGKNPGPPPSFDALPAEARFVNQALIWYTDRIFEAEQSARHQSGDEIEGIAASPGQYQGQARIIRSESEFHRLQPGDVLVCPITSPVWSVLFLSIGALVTDTGGILSHPAIIAREYRVPAVVATGNATAVLSDGQIVTVDGTTGRVTTSMVPTPVPPRPGQNASAELLG